MLYTVLIMKILKQEYEIKAPVSLVWKALTSPRIITKWGGGPVKMSAKKGFKFSFWGGDITGKNTKVIKEKLLAQDWMAGKWDDYSKVTFKLSSKKDVTRVILTQSGVPAKEYKDIADGWERYYMGEVKKLLEDS